MIRGSERKWVKAELPEFDPQNTAERENQLLQVLIGLHT